jgi:hypothetical protein
VLLHFLTFLVGTLVHKAQSTDWVRSSSLTDPMDVQLVKAFEKRFPRTQDLPCNPVRDCGLEKMAKLEEGVKISICAMLLRELQ